MERIVMFKRGMPEKMCPKCQTSCHARKKVCDNCGFDFKSNRSNPQQSRLGSTRLATNLSRKTPQEQLQWACYSMIVSAF